MVNQNLLNLLVCPETKQPVALAPQEAVDSLNAQIANGGVTNRSGGKLSERIDGLLVREDGRFGYPIIGDIPIMLIDEAVPLEG